MKNKPQPRRHIERNAPLAKMMIRGLLAALAIAVFVCWVRKSDQIKHKHIQIKCNSNLFKYWVPEQHTKSNT